MSIGGAPSVCLLHHQDSPQSLRSLADGEKSGQIDRKMSAQPGEISESSASKPPMDVVIIQENQHPQSPSAGTSSSSRSKGTPPGKTTAMLPVSSSVTGGSDIKPSCNSLPSVVTSSASARSPASGISSFAFRLQPRRPVKGTAACSSPGGARTSAWISRGRKRRADGILRRHPTALTPPISERLQGAAAPRQSDKPERATKRSNGGAAADSWSSSSTHEPSSPAMRAKSPATLTAAKNPLQRLPVQRVENPLSTLQGLSLDSPGTRRFSPPPAPATSAASSEGGHNSSPLSGIGSCFSRYNNNSTGLSSPSADSSAAVASLRGCAVGSSHPQLPFTLAKTGSFRLAPLTVLSHDGSRAKLPPRHHQTGTAKDAGAAPLPPPDTPPHRRCDSSISSGSDLNDGARSAKLPLTECDAAAASSPCLSRHSMQSGLSARTPERRIPFPLTRSGMSQASPSRNMTPERTPLPRINLTPRSSASRSGLPFLLGTSPSNNSSASTTDHTSVPRLTLTPRGSRHNLSASSNRGALPVFPTTNELEEASKVVREPPNLGETFVSTSGSPRSAAARSRDVAMMPPPNEQSSAAVRRPTAEGSFIPLPEWIVTSGSQEESVAPREASFSLLDSSAASDYALHALMAEARSSAQGQPGEADSLSASDDEDDFFLSTPAAASEKQQPPPAPAKQRKFRTGGPNLSEASLSRGKSSVNSLSERRASLTSLGDRSAQLSARASNTSLLGMDLVQGFEAAASSTMGASTTSLKGMSLVPSSSALQDIQNGCSGSGIRASTFQDMETSVTSAAVAGDPSLPRAESMASIGLTLEAASATCADAPTSSRERDLVTPPGVPAPLSPPPILSPHDVQYHTLSAAEVDSCHDAWNLLPVPFDDHNACFLHG